MTDDLERRLREEGEAFARESGWPDELYFGLLERARTALKGSRHE